MQSRGGGHRLGWDLGFLLAHQAPHLSLVLPDLRSTRRVQPPAPRPQRSNPVPGAAGETLDPLFGVGEGLLQIRALTLCICPQAMAEQLAENYHNTWGRKKKQELEAKGEGIHPTPA